MSRYELAREALDDLDELWLYVAEGSVDAANRIAAAILDACDLLVDHPHIGHTRTDLTDRPETKPLRVVAVLHASRDVATLLTDRE